MPAAILAISGVIDRLSFVTICTPILDNVVASNSLNLSLSIFLSIFKQKSKFNASIDLITTSLLFSSLTLEDTLYDTVP